MSHNGALRIAWWSPLPPQKSGIADYSFDLLSALAPKMVLTAVVRDDVVGLVRAPKAVEVVGATEYLTGLVGKCDLEVYQMGNHLGFHGYMHRAALSSPGLLVLHDLSLFDFYAVACGSVNSAVLLEEVAIDSTSLGAIPTLLVDGRRVADELAMPLSRRLIEASVVTMVHSATMRDQLAQQYPAKPIRQLNQPVRILQTPEAQRNEPREVIFGIFGSLERHKRVPVAVKAFARVNRSYPNRARLVIAGRADNPSVEREVLEIIRSSGMLDAVEVLTDLRLDDLEAEIARCDVAICLRWPTAGEVSAVLMRALGAGKAVIVTDVPQYKDLDPTFAWKVPIEPSQETNELERLMTLVVEQPDLARKAGDAALRFVKAEATVSGVAQRYREVIEECLALAGAAAKRLRPGADGRIDVPGVNVLADWQATTGLAEAARRSVGALIEAGVSVAAHEVKEKYAPHESERIPSWVEDLPIGRPHDIEICYLNVNELNTITDAELRPPRADNYLIGHWFWELPSLARGFIKEIERIDEIWVGSRFTQEALMGHTDKPVHVMPCVVNAHPLIGATRADFDLPEKACVFLFHFDAASTLARKNPWAVIQAFRKAFPPGERQASAHLVLKTINLSSCPPVAGERLLREMQEAGGTLLDTELSGAAMASLIACSDVYVSLHRSEGFGLGIAEAMLAGRPAIATAYSGNLDFMSHQNSCLVGYRLCPVTRAETQYNPGMEFVYEEGQLWADAHVSQAARWMRFLYENPSERKRIGAAGASTIATYYSSGAAGAVAKARLMQISQARIFKRGREIRP
ncbi:MAG: glycosyltransferase [Acidimicrobiales bacterium]